MPSYLSRLRLSATAAHGLPLAAFLLLNLLPGALRIDNSELPWFQRAPEHWVYPLQTLVCGGLLVFFRRHYQLAPWRGLGLAACLGGLGVLVWILPVWLLGRLGGPAGVPAWLTWLGAVPRTDGFDPGVLAPWPGWQACAVGLRLLRLVVVVPLVEELFWRGFLMRYVSAGAGPWQRVPFGRHDWKAYGLVTLLVVLAHAPADYFAAWIWGSLVYVVAVRTRSLGACVGMHALANLLLGAYVLHTRQWGFW